MEFKTLYWEEGFLKLLDQRLLPGSLGYVSCPDAESVREAIKNLTVRGAPAIGAAAAYGMVLGAQNCGAETSDELIARLKETAKRLKSSRPTAVNLSWAAERMMEKAVENSGKTPAELKEILLAEARKISEEDRETCRKLSFLGAELIKDGDSVITYCNAGALATAGMGTALGVIYAAAEQGKRVKVFACETRPLLQGARLTSWELSGKKIDAVLICDNTAGWVMKKDMANAVITGADRIAPNGDSANKIGSYPLAVLAKFHKIPFYVAAPLSTFDFSIASGEDIPIEERPGEEVANFAGVRTAPPGMKTFSPAFDVVPAKLISAIITEKGVILPPFRENIRKIKS
jgi:methylthioribose-1-phosphate isomerase